ncbi:MAG: hypothetical protein OEQ25_12525, partial [Gammaproteobacteria bacterium]|nr:hypothetical protein [Gammaproteobacteria bacterium]
RLTTTSEAWEIYFPASALQIAGDVVTLTLPQHPAHAQLPAFNFANITLYRLDDGAVPETMYRYLWNRRANPLPSFAMLSDFAFL